MSRFSLAIVVLMIFAWTSTASAQAPRPERPYRGLFRGTGENVPERLLVVSGLIGGGYDDNVFAETGVVPGGVGTEMWQSGMFVRGGGGLAYTHTTDPIDFGASFVADTRYFPDVPQDLLTSYSGAIGMSTQLARNTRLGVNQVISYQPFLTFDLFPSLYTPTVSVAEAPLQEQATPFDDYMLYRTSVDLRQGLSRRAGLEFSYSYELSDFTRETNDFRVQQGSGRYTYEVARGLGLRVGYGYGNAKYSDPLNPRTVSTHAIDVGVDYSRALSISRRTTLSFATGSAALSDFDDTRYHIVGSVELNHEIGRTWNTGIAYSRNVAFVRTFNEPFFQDSVSSQLTGLITRRLEFHLSAAASFGKVGFQAGANDGYESYTAGTLLSYALTRYLALSASYNYYRYSFESGVAMPFGMSPATDRQSAQILLNMWFPLYQRF